MDMKKKSHRAAFALLVVLMMPMAAFAVVHGVDVGGISVTDPLVNEGSVSVEGWQWDAGTKTLTLNSRYNLAPSSSGHIYIACDPTDTVRLVYSGGIKIDGKGGYEAISCVGNLEITGTLGMLTLYSVNRGAIASQSGTLSIGGDAKITAISGAISGGSAGEIIGAALDVTIKDNASITAISTASGYGGIHSGSGSVNINTAGDVTVDVDASENLKNALFAGNEIDIQKGTVNITVNNPDDAFNNKPKIKGDAKVYVNGNRYNSGGGGGGGCNFGGSAYILIAFAGLLTLKIRRIA